MGLIPLPPLYARIRPISKSKLDDLHQLLPFVPPVYHDFYAQLSDHGLNDSDSDESDVQSESEKTYLTLY